jgi:REP element-mobilizing transposase RayT
MELSIYHKRQGQMGIKQAYFYTDTINNFQHLLADDNLKMIVINSLKYLVEKGLVETYGYVIMPNHIHLIWNILQQNGKESPAGSFAKFTAHEFKKYLTIKSPNLLLQYQSNKEDRKFQFWKRDPLAIPLSTEAIFIQKLEYIHNNPLKEKWQLSKFAEDYKWSSANFYMNGKDEFGFVKHFL